MSKHFDDYVKLRKSKEEIHATFMKLGEFRAFVDMVNKQADQIENLAQTLTLLLERIDVQNKQINQLKSSLSEFL